MAGSGCTRTASGPARTGGSPDQPGTTCREARRSPTQPGQIPPCASHRLFPWAVLAPFSEGADAVGGAEAGGGVITFLGGAQVVVAARLLRGAEHGVVA